MSLQDALLIHRAAENHQGVALMVRDPILMSMAAAWAKVKRQLPDPLLQAMRWTWRPSGRKLRGTPARGGRNWLRQTLSRAWKGGKF